jgi:acyl-CoA hydrolase
VDFVLGAAFSEGGKSIIALPSTARDGKYTRLVTMLTRGSGVVTTRAHVDYIVTEYGIARLRGRSVTERARELIAIAHPDFRETLQREAHEQLGLQL